MPGSPEVRTAKSWWRGVDLHHDRVVGNESVALADNSHGVADQSPHVGGECFDLLRMGPEDQVVLAQHLPAVEAVEQAQGVHHLRVVGIAVVGPGQGLAGVLEPVDAQQVDAERGVSAPQVGVQLQRALQLGDGFAVAVADHVEVGDGLEHRAVTRSDGQHLVFPRARDSVGDVVHRRHEAHGFEPLPGVLGGHGLLQGLTGSFVVPHLQRQTCK